VDLRGGFVPPAFRSKESIDIERIWPMTPFIGTKPWISRTLFGRPIVSALCGRKRRLGQESRLLGYRAQSEVALPSGRNRQMHTPVEGRQGEGHRGEASGKPRNIRMHDVVKRIFALGRQKDPRNRARRNRLRRRRRLRRGSDRAFDDRLKGPCGLGRGGSDGFDELIHSDVSANMVYI